MTDRAKQQVPAKQQVLAKPETPTQALIQAGAYPAELLRACQIHGLEVTALLGWAVRADEVALLLPDYRKLRVAIQGTWGQGAADAPAVETAAAAAGASLAAGKAQGAGNTSAGTAQAARTAPARAGRDSHSQAGKGAPAIVKKARGRRA